MKITMVQTGSIQNKVPDTLRHLDELCASLKRGETDLLLLPEMFSSGFTLSEMKGIASHHDTVLLPWIEQLAHRLDAAVVGSTIVEKADGFYNQMVAQLPDGTRHLYDKHHLFTMSGENTCYVPGNTPVIFQYRGAWISLWVCYDLRFPAWCRNNRSQRYDIALFSANWPKTRIVAWKTLLAARAIENESYVVGVNRVGRDELDIEYSGESMAAGPRGERYATLPPNVEQLQTIELDMEELQRWRAHFPVFPDFDEYTLKNEQQ